MLWPVIVTARGCRLPPDESSQADQDSTRQQFIRVKLRKPMGMVLSEKSNNVVFVEEISAGGNADKSGKVQVGDVISKCSAYVLKSGKDGDYEREGYGKRPYTNWEPIMFDCTGQDFKTVMSAISSNNDRWGIFDVTLELRRSRSN
ncbi:hypothetical protein WJX74_000829 [Apatococcus lobatus]|uniref:PDZ domain-containing protein n=1 Tax=Apatococcus lobatus TaxID=904363 RepID=A0AAW1SAL1_9CHLO